MQLSQIDQARHSTNFKLATGSDLDRLANFYQLTRPATFPRDDWENVMKAIVYAVKGTYSNLFNVLYWLFKAWIISETYENVSIDAFGRFTLPVSLSKGRTSKIVKLTFTDGSSDFYYVSSIVTVGTPPLTVSYYRLANSDSGYKTSYFKTWKNQNTAINVKMEFMPFLILETNEGGLGNTTKGDLSNGQVLIYLDSTLAKTPPTYMKDDGEERDENEPFGGQLLELFDIDNQTLDFGNQEIGPFPIYLSGSNMDSIFGDLLKKIMPAGIRYSVYAIDWDGVTDFPPIFTYAQNGLFP
jgi:hypothetical protein